MPTPSKPASPTNPNAEPRNMPRLKSAARTINVLASLFVFAFLCAYARTALRYGGSPRTQTTAAITRPATQTFFTPTHSRSTHRRQSFFRPVHQLKRHARRRISPFYLASLRRIRRLFSQLLVVRS